VSPVPPDLAVKPMFRAVPEGVHPPDPTGAMKVYRPGHLALPGLVLIFARRRRERLCEGPPPDAGHAAAVPGSL
jgi:MYXO-CTERM domain-containing protein